MSEVLELKNYRKPKKEPVQRVRHNEWYCRRCDSNAFRIRDHGEILCAACDIPIKNLVAVPR